MRPLFGTETIIASPPESSLARLLKFRRAHRELRPQNRRRVGDLHVPGDPGNGRANFSLIRYEDLRAAPTEQFRDLLTLLGEQAPDVTTFERALEFSRFENMQKLEAAGAFDSNILHPGDVRDPESFKVRRGKIGGYREYLSAEDQQYAAEAMTELDRRFGYSA